MASRLLTGKAAAKIILELIREAIAIDFSVAWAGQDNRVFEALVDAKKKLRHAVIGTHWYQTDPRALSTLQGNARYVPPDGRLFHPKVYLFQMDGGKRAVIGSHNLTAGAFEDRNIEASVQLTSSDDDATLNSLSKFLEIQWKQASDIEDAFLFSYSIQHDATKAARAALNRFQRLPRPKKSARESVPLGLSWESFVARVQDDPHHGFQGRLSILNSAKALLGRTRFEDLSRDERRAIGGTYGPTEEQLDGLDWGWFGRMFGFGDFKNLVNESPATLSSALDSIPFDGDVTEDEFIRFARRFRKAFDGATRTGGVATATRLLAMKRPDVFVCVNRANRDGLCAAYGVAPTTLSLDNYWERIVVPTQLGPWWRAPRPRGSASLIWDFRAALVDCLYYDPTR